MKLPAGYGQVVKLSGKRRRPFAVRIDEGPKEVAPGKYRRKIRYLEYFEKRADAMDYLAKYNAGIIIDKKVSVAALPTFSEIYTGFMRFYESKNKEASRSAFSAYETAYKRCASLHNKKFVSLRTDDLQAAIRDNSTMSKSTVANLIKLFHGMYKYAMMNELADKDYSQYVFPEYSQKEEEAHKPFEESEISALWAGDLSAPLVMIYTGLRVGEFLTIENENIDLSAHIMRGGIKTKAGKNRVIPIHDAILPIVKDMMSGEKYLFGGAKKITREKFLYNTWNPAMSACSLDHIPHDTRHTTATLMEKYGVSIFHQKLILGHSVQDLTQGVYTHVKPTTLVEDINKIPTFH